MSMRELERMIVAEAKEVSSNDKLRLKNLAHWSTSENVTLKQLRDDEELIVCPKLGVWAAFVKLGKK